MTATSADEPKRMGDFLELAEHVQQREVKEWRNTVDTVTNFLNGVVDQSKQQITTIPERFEETAKNTRELSRQMTQAVQVWSRTKEQFEANKAYVDLQNKLIEGWPKSWVADRTFYLGVGLLGGGGIAYGLLGSAALVDYALLWGIGAVLLGISIVAAALYDRDRSRYFAKVRERVR